jgi:adenylate cyclase
LAVFVRPAGTSLFVDLKIAGDFPAKGTTDALVGSRMRTLLAELRRRNVLKVAAGYIVVAWLALQVLDVLAPILQLSTWLQRAILLLLAIGLLVTLALSWVYDLTPLGLRRTQETPSTTTSAASTDATSIAVLPFTDLSADHDQEYFGDGLAEELLNVLIQVERLSVASRTSSFAFRGKALPLPDIAHALHVQYLVEGSVRRSGDHIRVAVQLTDARTDRDLWARTFDRELVDIFAIQDEIARDIAAALRVELKPARGAAQTDDVAAYDLYLLGMYHWNQRTPESLQTALAVFQKAVARDPGFARAWAGLAMTHMILPAYAGFDAAQSYREALDAARKAVQLDPGSAEAHTALGGALFFSFADDAPGRAAFARALAINPNFATTHHWLGILLTITGQLAEGEAELRAAHALDPASLPIQSYLCINLAHQGRWSEALAESEAVVQRAPDYRNTLVQSFVCGAMLGRGREFLPGLRRYFGVIGEDPGLADAVIDGLEETGPRDVAITGLAAIARRHGRKSYELQQIAALLALLQARAQTLELLEQLETPDNFNLMALVPYGFLHEDPRYEALLARRATRQHDAAVPQTST